MDTIYSSVFATLAEVSYSSLTSPMKLGTRAGGMGLPCFASKGAAATPWCGNQSLFPQVNRYTGLESRLLLTV